MNGNPQTNYDINLAPTIDGMAADSRDKVIEPHAGLGTILFGMAVFSAQAIAGVRVAKRNQAANVLSGDLVTSNVINVTVNGVAISPVTFATDHLTTATAVAAAIDAALLTMGVVSVSTVGGSSNRTITTIAQDTSVIFTSWAVTLGGSQATVTTTYSTSSVFRGIATWIQQQLVSPGVAGYANGDAVGVGRRGLWAVRARGAAMTDDTDVYACLATAGDEGGFTTVSTGNVGPVGKSRSACDKDALFYLELNMP